jgi:hypothetical protein
MIGQAAKAAPLPTCPHQKIMESHSRPNQGRAATATTGRQHGQTPTQDMQGHTMPSDQSHRRGAHEAAQCSTSAAVAATVCRRYGPPPLPTVNIVYSLLSLSWPGQAASAKPSPLRSPVHCLVIPVTGHHDNRNFLAHETISCKSSSLFEVRPRTSDDSFITATEHVPTCSRSELQ